MNVFSKDVGSDFSSATSLAQVTLSEKWRGVKGNQDVDRTQERSQPDDCKEYWQSWELSCSVKTIFSFAHCLELSHVLKLSWWISGRRDHLSFGLNNFIFRCIHRGEILLVKKEKKSFFKEKLYRQLKWTGILSGRVEDVLNDCVSYPPPTPELLPWNVSACSWLFSDITHFQRILYNQIRGV